MKRKILFCLSAVFCLMGIASAQAADTPAVYLDGEPMTFDVAPIVQNDRTMVPYRAVFEELGYTVSWNAQEQSISAMKDGASMWMQIGNKNITVNGKNVVSDAAPFLQNGRTLMPLRLVSEYSGCDVLWDGAAETVAMYRKQAKNAMSEKVGCVTTDGDSLLVEHSDIVTREHGTQGYSLVNLSPIAFIPDYVVETVDQETKTGYGQVAKGPVYSNISPTEEYRSITMVTGETLAESPSDMLQCWPALQRDPVQGTLYSSANIDGEDLLFQIDPSTMKVRKTFKFPSPQYIYDNKLLVIYYSNEKLAGMELHQIDLETGENSCIFQSNKNVTDHVLFGNELYLSLSGEQNEILVYDINHKTTYTIPIQDKISSFDVTQNSIFYLTDSKTPSSNSSYALYRISKNGTLRILLQDNIVREQLDTFSTSLKVIGNTIYYYIRDYGEEHRIYNTSVKNPNYTLHPYMHSAIASLCALPTCGGAPYVVDRSYWNRGSLMS